MLTARDLATGYADAVLAGTEPAGRWIYAAAKRFRADLERPDLVMDWDSVEALREHFGRLTLVGEASGRAFELHPWQVWCLANIVGWRWREDGRRRVKLAMLQIARGNGKTTLMAGLALWDLLQDTQQAAAITNHQTKQEAALW